MAKDKASKENIKSDGTLSKMKSDKRGSLVY